MYVFCVLKISGDDVTMQTLDEKSNLSCRVGHARAYEEDTFLVSRRKMYNSRVKSALSVNKVIMLN